MSARIEDRFADYFEVLQPSHIAEYLATQHWACLADKPFGQLWALPEQRQGQIASIVLPKSPKSPDYNRRLAESLSNLTKILDTNASDLAEAVATVHADLFFLRVDQSMVDGTIPLRQATQLLENIDRMIRSAALAAYSPHHSGQGKIPNTVSEFLSDDVRMGHTKRGSFIITVAARHDDKPPILVEATPNAETPNKNEVGFTRQVMTTLSTALDATRRHVSKSNDFMDLDAAVSAGVRYPLVEALSDIGDAEGLRRVDINFSWSKVRPQDNDVPEKVSFTPAELSELDEVSTKLRRKIQPQEETLVGSVTELRRSEAPSTSQDTGEIVLRADFDGRVRNVRIELGGADYEAAIRAHQARTPLVAHGTLGKKGNTWRMSGRVTVNSSFEDMAIDAPVRLRKTDEAGTR